MKITDKKRALSAVEELKKLYPESVCSLESGGDPWRLLVMARLSAQCTDERVNIVCRNLFRELPTVEKMAEAPVEQIENLIKSCGLYRSKAKSIKESSEILVRDFSGQVPDNMEDLLSLSGVGRKIANLILGDVYGKGGIVADTHCIRITNRLGLCEKADPVHVERTLTPIVPKNEQSDMCHRLVNFGRDICCARNPKCDICPMKKGKICPYKP